MAASAKSDSAETTANPKILVNTLQMDNLA